MMLSQPAIAIHLTAALGALCLGPVALWARRGPVAGHRPRLHRAFGYAWVTAMITAAVSSLFIRDWALPNIAGYTPLHLFVPLTAWGLVGAFRGLARRDWVQHRKSMIFTYVGACCTAGLFALLPQRALGQWVWGTWLGWL